MAGEVSLQDILGALDTPQEHTKTAEHNTDDLRAEIEQMLSETHEKTASEVTGDDLEKIAKEVIASQDDVMLQDARMVGAAMYDGWAMRQQAYGAAHEKTAAAEEEAQYAILQKFAEENPDLCFEAIKEGARDAELMKSAETDEMVSKVAFQRGYWDAQAIFEANDL
jgi:hypothetical protein